MSGQDRILIVDDSRLNINILVDALQDEFELVIAKNGEKALQRARAEQTPDLILLDVMMPGMNGYEVCEQLKADPQTKDIPVIFLTAKQDPEDELQGLKLGAVDYVTKPFGPAIVRARVKTQLRLKHMLEELEEKNAALEQAAGIREHVERIARHDLKSPLTIICTIPDILLLQLDLDAKQTKLMKSISDAGWRMAQMINRSLDIYKMETGSYFYQPTSLNLLSVLDTVLEEVQPKVLAKRSELKLSSSPASILDDEMLLIQAETFLCNSIFGNLLRNAIEASPIGEPVWISITKEDAFVAIKIRNSGEVPHDIRQSFFEKYATSGKSFGTGLGTYSARLMTEAQGGKIQLDYSEAGYTSVTVKLSL